MIFLFATELEAELLRKNCPTAHIEICGVGAVAFGASLARILSTSYKGEHLILAGIAGSYDLNDVAICEVVEVVSEQVCALPAKYAKRYTLQPSTTLRAVTSNSVNGDTESQKINNLEPRPQIESMEGAAFMAICQELKIRATEIRAISNHVGEHFTKWRVNDALEALTAELVSLATDSLKDRC